MVVRDLHIVGIRTLPAKADAPLIVDPNAVLSLPATNELLQTIPRGRPQVIQQVRSIKNQEFPESRPLDLGRKTRCPDAPEYPFRVPILEAADHGPILTPPDHTVKRYVPRSNAGITGGWSWRGPGLAGLRQGHLPSGQGRARAGRPVHALVIRLLSRGCPALSANMPETLDLWEFSVEGERG